jgi:hypothetical protein
MRLTATGYARIHRDKINGATTPHGDGDLPDHGNLEADVLRLSVEAFSGER